MSIWGGIIGAASGLLSGSQQAHAAWAQQSRDIQTQKEFAQHGIQWRVADAVRAGVHPLFALGGSGATFSPSAMPVLDKGIAEAGRHLSAAVNRAGETAEQYEAKQAALDAARAASAKDYAIAEYYASEAARNRQGAQAGAPFPSTGDPSGFLPKDEGSFGHQGTQEGAAAINPFFDRRLLKPREVTSRSSLDRSQSAGSGPMWDVYQLKDSGMMMDLPAGSSVSEALETMAESKVILGWVLARNVEKYGQKWFVEFMKSYGSLFNWQ